jgi:hypothetical protein
MTKPMIRLHNADTNEIVDREMTDEEYLAYKDEQDKSKLEADKMTQTAADKVALLAKLGITEDEARLLLS